MWTNFRGAVFFFFFGEHCTFFLLNDLRLSFLYVLFHELIVTRMGNVRSLSFMPLFEACQTSRFEEEDQGHEFVTECIALLVIKLVWFAAIGMSSRALLTGSYLFLYLGIPDTVLWMCRLLSSRLR